MMAMKILLITSGYPNAWKLSSGIFIKRQVDFLEASGEFYFDVLSTGDSRIGIYSFIKYVRLILQVLLYSFLHHDFDMIHAHEIFPAGFLALIPKFLRAKKLLVTLHGGPLYSSDAGGVLIKRLIALTLRNVDGLICVSGYLRDRSMALFPAEVANKIMEIINMGVVLDQFQPIPKTEARIRLGLTQAAPDKKIVMFVGRLIERKGVIYMIRAARILKDENLLQKIDMIVVGGGAEEERLNSEAVRLGVSADICFTGAKPPEEIHLWMSAADILLIPSLDEGFGLVALEAMACGTPVISTDCGGLKEFVKHEENGLLVKTQDAHGLAQGIIALLNDPSLYRKIVKNGFKTAQQNSAEGQALRVGEIYHSLVLGGDK